jgi:4-amino-4-deoxy-L-arabinose transferase-like glycosyltransferase
VWLAWRRRDAADRLLLVAGLFVVVFFSLSTEKRELYALPAFPAFALLIGRLVGHLCGRDPSRDESGPRVSVRWATAGLGVLGGLLALLGAAAPWAAERAPVDFGRLTWVLGGLALASGAVTLLVAVRGEVLHATAVSAAGVSLLYLVASGWVFPLLDPVKSARGFASRMERATASYRARGGQILAYDLRNLAEPLAFYTDGVYTVETRDRALLAEHLAAVEPAYAVVNAPALGELSGRLGDRLVLIDEARLSRRDVLLVANTGAAPPASG